MEAKFKEGTKNKGVVNDVKDSRKVKKNKDRIGAHTLARRRSSEILVSAVSIEYKPGSLPTQTVSHPAA